MQSPANIVLHSFGPCKQFIFNYYVLIWTFFFFKPVKFSSGGGCIPTLETLTLISSDNPLPSDQPIWTFKMTYCQRIVTFLPTWLSDICIYIEKFKWLKIFVENLNIEKNINFLLFTFSYIRSKYLILLLLLLLL